MQKIKLFIESEKGKDIMTIMIVILVGIISFYLGRLSTESTKDGLKIEYSSQKANIIDSNKALNDPISLNPSISERINNNSQGSYFASSRGKKYYPIGCSAGKSLKEENRIYFQTTSEAEKAGYTLSSSC
jgi:hypothetical protein